MRQLLFIATIVLFFSCRNKNAPDVSHIKVDVQIDRFEKAFFSVDTNNLATGLAHLRNAYPNFYPTFMRDILQVNPGDSSSFPVIKTMIGSYLSFNDSIQQKYSDLDWLQLELNYSFRYVKYYYPDYTVPRIITFLGTLDAPGVIMAPGILGIGLHQYAGKNFSAYQAPDIQGMYPAYISRLFDREYISVNCMKAVADDIYPDQSVGRPMIEQMIEKGKQWYLVDHFSPDAPDSAKTGYTQQQLDWVTENEGNVWAYLIKNENLYSIEPHVIQNYIGPNPFTQNMPQTSPGNIGQWIGWRIVQKFADKNNKLTLEQVVQTPARTVFDGANYRPK